MINFAPEMINVGSFCRKGMAQFEEVAFLKTGLPTPNWELLRDLRMEPREGVVWGVGNSAGYNAR